MSKNLKIKRRREDQLSYCDIEKMILLSFSEDVTPEEICKANDVDLKNFIDWRETFLSGGGDRLRNRSTPKEQTQEIKIKQQDALIQALKREIKGRQDRL